MKNTIKYIFLLLLWLCSSDIVAVQHYTFRNLTMTDGLSGLLVNTIYKDSDGFIWLGTDNCLDRFDGVKVKHFAFRGGDTRRKRVNAVAETADRGLWAGNGLGLWRLNRAADALESIASETIDFGVNALLSDGNDLYIGTEKGVFVQKGGQLKQILVDKNVLSASNRVMALHLDKQKNILWIATVRGLHACSLVDGVIRSWHLDENIPDADYFRCLTSVDETLYCGTMSQGVMCFNTAKGSFTRFPSLGCDIISSISTDGKDLVYVSTDGNGVHFLSHRKRSIVRSICHDVRDKESIRSNSVYSLLVDDRGIVWVGLYQGGVDYSLYQSGLFETYAFPPLFDSKDLSVRSFLNYGKEKLIGSRDGLFYINEDTQVVKSFSKPILTADLILTMCYYEGDFYVGTYGGGLMVLDRRTLNLQSYSGAGAENFHRGQVFRLCPDAKGNLWIATSQGLFCYNASQNQLKGFSSSNSQLPEGNVYEINFDTTGKGWICTENGMAIYDPASQSIRSNIFPEGFLHKDKVRVMYEDSRHDILLMPEKGSLFITSQSMDRFHRMPIIPVVPENAFMSVIEDNLGWLWMGSNDGLVRMKKDGEEYDFFTFNDGLPSPTFTMGSAYKDEHGTLWFGNTKGLIYVDPQQIDDIRREIRPIIFTDLSANGTTVTDSVLKSTQNNLTFSFSDLSYGLPSAMIFEYRLDGVDKEWQLLSGQNRVSYYDLSSGRYTFRVRLPGNENSESAMGIKIDSMFPWWFWVVVVLGLLVAPWVVIRYMKRIIARTAHALQNEKRTKTDDDASQMSLPIAGGRNSNEPEVAEEDDRLGDKPAKSEEKYKTIRLNEDECKMLLSKLKTYMKEEKPYTNSDLKLGDLASAIQTSSHYLSYLFNQYLNQPYYDFVNEYRIAEFKVMVSDPKYTRYTLTALAELCGFSSRASFFRSFKKITGITPNEYIRSIGGIDKVE